MKSIRVTSRLRSFGTGLVVVAAFAAWAAASTAGDAISTDADASKPFLVKIHADWCGTCTRLNPTFEALEKNVGGEARIVVFDVTDKKAVAASRAEADRLGLRTFFDQYKSKTGTVGVLRGDTRETVEIMKGVTDVARYEAALDRARTAT